MSVPVQSIMLHRLNLSYPVLGYDRGLVGLLGKKKMGKRLDDLLKKREQLNAQIHQEKNKHSQQKRKEDTRRKILLGALMMDLMKKGELDEKKILKRLDGFLTKEMERKLFDLTLINEGSKQKVATTKSNDSPTVEIILESVLKKNRIPVIKAIRGVTGLDLKETVELMDAAPTSIIKVGLNEAEEIKKRLMEAGAKVSLKK